MFNSCKVSYAKFLPLYLVEIYLLFTLIVFFFGPVHFAIHNKAWFFVYIFLYHLFFVFGYILGAKSFRFASLKSELPFCRKKFRLLFFFGLAVTFLGYSNNLLGFDLSPSTFFKTVYDGFSNAGQIYTDRMANVDSSLIADSNSRFINSLSFLFAFSQFLFIFYSVYYWNFFRFSEKSLFIIFSIFYLLSGVFSGVNSPNFYYLIFISCSLLSLLYIRRDPRLIKALWACTLLFFIPILIFGNIMSQRGGSFQYFIGTSSLGDISVSSNFMPVDSSSLLYILLYSFVWLSYYLVQGYYGFSLILDLDHIWTFGFGNSAFLQRQFAILSGVNISSETFQARISNIWDQSAQWHSAYGQFANDFGLEGLVFFMSFLGFFLSRVWISALYQKSFYAAALLPILTIMFIFFPANNQIFGFIGFLSYFIVVTLLWLFEMGRIRVT